MTDNQPQITRDKQPHIFWLSALTAHGFVAATWWWMMPGGFAVSHPRFWMNQVLPVAVFIAVVLLRFKFWRHPAVRDRLLLMMPVFWISLAVSSRFVYPISAAFWFVAPLLFAIVLTIASLPILKRLDRFHIPTFLIAAAIGVLLPVSQRGRDAATIPSTIVFETVGDAPAEGISSRTITISPDLQLHPAGPVLIFHSGRFTLSVQPTLDFISRSPDRCWSLFARRADRMGITRRLISIGQSENHIALSHRDSEMSRLDISHATPGVIELVARSRLESAVYSHLNTFTELTLSGHKKLSVEFSPAKGRRIEFKPFNIQGSSPARCAYIDAEGMFRIVEASRNEKGPFTTLAGGLMKKSDPLVMTFYDQDQPRYELTFHDWAAQASTQISPTAGWGLPVNAIEFSLDGDNDKSSAGVWITLAATSVGRGWDTVGHTPGVYRNRMTIRRMD